MNMNQPHFKPLETGASPHPKQAYQLSPFELGAKPEPRQGSSGQHPDLSWGELNEAPPLSEEVPVNEGDGFIDFTQSPLSLGEAGSDAPSSEHTPTIPPSVH